MTTDQQIEQLKWAAVAMGYKLYPEWNYAKDGIFLGRGFGDDPQVLWQPHLSHEASDLMGAELGMCVWWHTDWVTVSQYLTHEAATVLFRYHNNSKSQALLAARMAVAEQIGRMKGERNG